MTRHVILGMGITGMSAAATLRETDRSAEIVMVSEDPYGYYSRPGLAYYLTGEVPEKQLYPFERQDWTALNVRLVKGQAVGLDRQQHLLQLRSGLPLEYDRLLLVVGAASVLLHVPGEDLKGVVKLDDFADAHEILSLASPGKTAVVVGGGVVALELVEGLLCRGVKVHYLLRGDRYWSNVLDEPESQIIENRLRHEGVELHYRTEIVEILGKKDKVEAIRTKQGEVIRCNLVGRCIGVRPRLELARSAGLDVERGIMVSEYLQTSDTDIFAAGDCAQVFDPQTRHTFVDSLWGPGRMQGRIAALNMAGQKIAYLRKVDINVLRLANVMISVVGAVGSGRDDDLVSVARGSSETWLQLPNSTSTEAGTEFNHLRLMVGERTLLGGLVLGDQKLSIPLQDLVDRQVDITPIRSKLLQAGPELGNVLMEHWISNRERG